MADFEPLAGISQDQNLQTAVLLLSRILNALPTPAAPGAALPITGAVSLVANQALSSVTTVSSVTNMANIGGLPANTAVFDLMAMAAQPLFAGWKVT
jgi:hypothetical protein